MAKKTKLSKQRKRLTELLHDYVLEEDADLSDAEFVQAVFERIQGEWAEDPIWNT